MPILDSVDDAFGRALEDHFDNQPVLPLILESDDGWSSPAMAPDWFLLPPDEWYAWERQQLEQLEGPVLDLGCGAGRASLFLQQQGCHVTAVDSSPGAIAVCKRRGIKDVRLVDFRESLPTDQRWQSVLLLCGNLGVAGGWDETRQLLSDLAAMSAPGARLIADTVDPTIGADAEFLAYQERMETRGAYRGEVRLRLRHGSRLTPWWTQTNVCVADMAALVSDTGWSVVEHEIAGMDHYVVLAKS